MPLTIHRNAYIHMYRYILIYDTLLIFSVLFRKLKTDKKKEENAVEDTLTELNV